MYVLCRLCIDNTYNVACDMIFYIWYIYVICDLEYYKLWRNVSNHVVAHIISFFTLYMWTLDSHYPRARGHPIFGAFSHASCPWHSACLRQLSTQSYHTIIGIYQPLTAFPYELARTSLDAIRVWNTPHVYLYVPIVWWCRWRGHGTHSIDMVLVTTFFEHHDNTCKYFTYIIIEIALYIYRDTTMIHGSSRLWYWHP